MARRSIIDEDDTADVDLSPMIACLFLILAFFIVATVFVEEQGLEVHKPDAAASASLEEKESVTFEITAENRILFENQEIGVGAVAGRVKANAKDEDTRVTIRAHETSNHGVFVSVWDAARRGGAKNLTFNTIN
jgi:biopolymer transport protein ExbD